MSACRGCFDLTNAKTSSRIGLVKPMPSPLTNTKPYRVIASTSRSAVSTASASLASDMSMTGICIVESLLFLETIFSIRVRNS